MTGHVCVIQVLIMGV